MSSLSNIFNNNNVKFSDIQEKAITNFYNRDLIEKNLKKKFIDDLKKVSHGEESDFVNTMISKYTAGIGGKRKRTKINKSRKNRTKSKRKRFV
jgi:hypothetical protein